MSCEIGYVKVDLLKALGMSDSQAIKTAIECAAATKTFIEFGEGTYTLDEQIRMDERHAGIRGIKGAGMGKTNIVYSWEQPENWDANTNKTDARKWCGIIVDSLPDVTLEDFSIEYKGTFHWKGETYRGSVMNIMMVDTTNGLVQRVESKGSNRIGIFFTSHNGEVVALGEQFKKGTITLDQLREATIKASGNRAIECHSHHNRVAGIAYAWQKDFQAFNNYCHHNGHEANGGTGYGITALSGSLNFGLNSMIKGNKLERNYRKGLDSHDAVDFIAEENNILDNRLHGFAYENRQYPVAYIRFVRNNIHFDGTFVLERDENVAEGAQLDLNMDYYRESGIRIEIKQQPWQTWVTQVNPEVIIEDNTIEGMNKIDTIPRGSYWCIEYRNNDQEATPVVKIRRNRITGNGRLTSFLSAFAKAPVVKYGLGDFTFSDNTLECEYCDGVPFYVEENSNAANDHSVIIENNIAKVTSKNTVTKATSLKAADKLFFRNNQLHLPADFGRPTSRFYVGNPAAQISFTDNDIYTQSLINQVRANWLDNSVSANTVIQRNRVLTINYL